jgi:hypothetical protein
VAGREGRRGECQNAVGFCFGAKAALDLVTVRAVAERRPPERSAVNERREAYLSLASSRVQQIGTATWGGVTYSPWTYSTQAAKYIKWPVIPNF